MEKQFSIFKSLKSANSIARIIWVGSIGEIHDSRPEVGVSTSNGRAYYVITSLLRRAGLRYVDLVLQTSPNVFHGVAHGSSQLFYDGNVKVVITTRRERVQFYDVNVLCIEDLGDDAGIARVRIFPYLYPARPTDWLIVGVDPGKRSGIAAFLNQRQVESCVIQSLDDTIARVCALIDNAPPVRKVIKIGSGNAVLAGKIAMGLESRYHAGVRIQLVNESGTSSLRRKRSKFTFGRTETRDQRAAKMIAFREGQDYVTAE